MDTFDKSLLETKPPQNNPIPAPPQREVEVRTMESDLKAFKESGGEVPLSGEKESFVSQSEQQPSVNQIANPYMVTPQDLRRASEAIHTSETSSVAEGSAAMSETAPTPTPGKLSGLVKNILITIIVLLIIAGAGYLGYAYVFPIIFK